MKFFNTAGPIDPKRHYHIPSRFNNFEIKQLIDHAKYFFLHGPRQSGKTTAIRMFIAELNKEGTYLALYINVEAAQIARDNVEQGMEIILGELYSQAKIYCDKDDSIFSIIENALKKLSGGSLKNVLQEWSLQSSKRLLIFIDEIDSLSGDTLISVLRQLRAGYANRPQAFIQSICLFGVHDVNHSEVMDKKTSSLLSGSAFNIKSESLLLSNFTLAQMFELYGQHTTETGQPFTDEAITRAYELTLGQPWLVNALAYEACFRDVIDRSQTITRETIDKAKETLIIRQDIHFNQLINQLQNPGILDVINAIVNNTAGEHSFSVDDLQDARNSGLINLTQIAIANPIYQEVIAKKLVHLKQKEFIAPIKWYQNTDKSINVGKLLLSFSEFYRENSEVWLEKFDYKKSGPHLLLIAFLQRIITEGGKIHREYTIGNKRVDLLIEWPYESKTSKQPVVQRVIIELKVKRSEKSIIEGLEKTVEFMDINKATEGHLILFDQAKNKPWNEKLFINKHVVGKYTVDVWGM